MKRVLRIGGLAIALVIAGVLLAYLAIEWHDAPGAPSPRLIGFAATTLFVFIDVVRNFRGSWGSSAFWLSTAGLLCVQVAAYVLVIAPIDEWRAIWFVPLGIGELVLFLQVLRALGFNEHEVSGGSLQSN
jgi:hypothetical protein